MVLIEGQSHLGTEFVKWTGHEFHKNGDRKWKNSLRRFTTVLAYPLRVMHWYATMTLKYCFNIPSKTCLQVDGEGRGGAKFQKRNKKKGERSPGVRVSYGLEGIAKLYINHEDAPFLEYPTNKTNIVTPNFICPMNEEWFTPPVAKTSGRSHRNEKMTSEPPKFWTHRERQWLAQTYKGAGSSCRRILQSAPSWRRYRPSCLTFGSWSPSCLRWQSNTTHRESLEERSIGYAHNKWTAS